MNNNKALLVGLVIVVILAMAGFYLLKEPLPTEPEAPAVALEKSAPAPAVSVPASTVPNPETGGKDHVLGSASAPVTVIEYASMTCSHCAHFATNLLPDVKAKLIAPGKMRLIFRDFPLDGVALKAAMLARCMPDEKYFDFVDLVFSSQQRWISNSDPVAGLQQLASLAGMDEKAFKACLANKALEQSSVDGVQKAQSKYKISSTPSFVFNDGAQVISGAENVNVFEDTINKLGGK